MQIPVPVKPVWVVGGPIGSPTGPTGLQGHAGEGGLIGLDGLLGVMGRTGVSGRMGLSGTDSTVTGPTGRPGPAGEVGRTGPSGPSGAALFPESHIAYFEHLPGAAGIGAGAGHYAGCRFFYQMKNGDRYLPVILTGLLQCTAGVTMIEIRVGVAPAPGPGAGLFSVGSSYQDLEQMLKIPPGTSIPFILMSKLYFSSDVEFWFDILVANSLGNNASVKNISALLVET
jgi:hypothetical protein